MSKQIVYALLLVLGIWSIDAAHADLITVTNSSCAIVGLYNTTAGGNGTACFPNPGTWPSGSYDSGEAPTKLLDGNVATKFATQKASVNTGFYVTLTAPAIVQQLQFATANDVSGRDPIAITIEGSNASGSDLMNGSSWTSLYVGNSGLESSTFANDTIGSGREVYGNVVSFNNTTAYTSYRVLVTATRWSSSDMMQLSEVKLNAIPEPSTTVLLGGAVVGVLAGAWRKRKS